MPRPPRCRQVSELPQTNYFKPRGIPLRQLEEVTLTIDELESLRLADLEGRYHEDAARMMDVSRQTFGRIIGGARKKVAEALVRGKALRIDGGEFRVPRLRTFQCEQCVYAWSVPHGTGRPDGCPVCKGQDFRRADKPGHWVSGRA